MQSWQRSPGPPGTPCSGGEQLLPQDLPFHMASPHSVLPHQQGRLAGHSHGASRARARYSEVSYLELDKFLEDVR